jgi:hypothetical protein
MSGTAKKIALAGTVLALTLGTFILPASAAPKDNGSLPETEGTYDVAGHPNLKLRVHVYRDHNEKNAARSQAKPGQTVPNLVCTSTAAMDPDSTAVTSPTGWKLPSGTWTYQLNLGSVPATVGAGNLATIAANSYSAWTSASGDLSSVVTFARGSDTTTARAQRDGKNIVTWGAASGALAIAYTWYDQSTGVAIEVDTIFAKNVTWYWSDPSTWPLGQACAYSGVYDAQNILTHELGHTIGLDDHYDASYINNTMYGYGSKGEVKKDTPSTGDVSGVNALY